MRTKEQPREEIWKDIGNTSIFENGEELAYFERIAIYSADIISLEKTIEKLTVAIFAEENDHKILALETTLAEAKAKLTSIWEIIKPDFDEVISKNQRLVAKIALDTRDSRSLSEKMSSGNEGLRKAILKFNPKLGNKFSTYAVWWIRQFIRRSKDEHQVIHVPVNRSDKFYRLRFAESTWQNLTGKIATDAEIAAIIILEKQREAAITQSYIKLYKPKENTSRKAIAKHSKYQELRKVLLKKEYQTKLDNAKAKLISEGNQNPTDQAILQKASQNYIDEISQLAASLDPATSSNPAEYFGVSADSVREIRSIRHNQTVIPSEFYNEDGEIAYSLVDNSPAAKETQNDPENSLAVVQTQALVRQTIKILTPREREVIMHHFGIQETEMTLQQIGDGINLTRERIRQIEEKALKKLKAHLEQNPRLLKSLLGQ